MSDLNVCCMPVSPAMEYAAIWLRGAGITVTEAPAPETTHFLLPVPTRCFDTLPENVVIVGGNLHCLPGYTVIDLLKDPLYLTENAAITARCAPKLVDADWRGLPVLVLGWGRIGKYLARDLREFGAEVTIAARKSGDLETAAALGYGTIPISDAKQALSRFRVVFNTIPAMVLPLGTWDGIAVELASKPGMSGGNIVDGKGLPGRLAPEASGELIARRFLALVKEGRL